MLSEPQVLRYSRHVLLPEIGGAGQERLLASEVAVSGLSEAGAWAAAYLALAGVGTIHLNDARPALSLLPFLSASDRGRPRQDALAAALPAWNPDVRAIAGGGAPFTLAFDGAGEGATLSVRAAGRLLQLAWADRVCPACRALPGPVTDPVGPEAALLGSLAAAEMVGRLLSRSHRPPAIRFEAGLPTNAPVCPHPA